VSAEDVAARSNVVGLCTWDDTSVRDVMYGEHGILAGAHPGTVVAVHATVQPQLCVDLAAELPSAASSSSTPQ